MRGTAALIAMRLRGHIPDWVFIDTDPPTDVCQADDWPDVNNTIAQLQTEAGERISRIDLRCVKGLPCYVDGISADRVRDMREACIEAGASRVKATLLERHGDGEWVAFRLIGATDTGMIEQPTTEEVTNG